MEERIASWLADPFVLGIAAYLFTTFLPKDRLDSGLGILHKWLEKWPFIGILFKFGRNVWDHSQAAAQKAQTQAQETKISSAVWAAKDLVRGVEQMKNSGAIQDNAIAAATVIRELEKNYGVDTQTAKLATEQAVYDMKMERQRLN